MDKIKILVKYGELTLKKKNAQTFKSTLYNNIKNALSNYDCEVKLSFSRMYIDVLKSDFEQVIVILKRIYGIHSFAPYVSCENNLDTIKKTAYECVKDLKYNTFKIETKRKNKQFDVSSLEVSRVVGGYINTYSNLNVDIHNPQLSIFIEIRNHETYIYYDEYQGAKGLPVSTSGKSILMLSGGIDSPIAGYLANKRGVKFDAIHFASPPYTAKESVDKIYDLCDVLKLYNGNFDLYVVKFTRVQEQLLSMKKISYFMTIMRRVMYRVCDKIATKYNYNAIINGDAIGQVASQTLESMETIDKVVNIPMIRPLAIFDKLEVIDIAKKIGTYDISIRPFEDCCTVFVPKSPAIKPKMHEVLRIEELFDIERMVDECLNDIEIVKITQNSNKFAELF